MVSPSGTFNLNGGVALIGCPIQGGGGTSTFNFNGGTLMVAGTSSTNFMQGLTGANVGNSGAFIIPTETISRSPRPWYPAAAPAPAA